MERSEWFILLTFSLISWPNLDSRPGHNQTRDHNAGIVRKSVALM